MISKVTGHGHFLILDDGSVWKSEDESESGGWSEGDEVFIKKDMIINVSRDVEKITGRLSGTSMLNRGRHHSAWCFPGHRKTVVIAEWNDFSTTTTLTSCRTR